MMTSSKLISIVSMMLVVLASPVPAWAARSLESLVPYQRPTWGMSNYSPFNVPDDLTHRYYPKSGSENDAQEFTIGRVLLHQTVQTDEGVVVGNLYPQEEAKPGTWVVTAIWLIRADSCLVELVVQNIPSDRNVVPQTLAPTQLFLPNKNVVTPQRVQENDLIFESFFKLPGKQVIHRPGKVVTTRRTFELSASQIRNLTSSGEGFELRTKLTNNQSLLIQADQNLVRQLGEISAYNPDCERREVKPRHFEAVRLPKRLPLPLNDVSLDHPDRPEIEALFVNQIMQGDDNGKFLLSNDVNRGEFAIMIGQTMELISWKRITNFIFNGFYDFDKLEKFKKENPEKFELISISVETGFITGVIVYNSRGKETPAFAAERKITREQVIHSLVRGLKAQGLRDFSPADLDVLKVYADASKIDQGMRESVAQAIQSGLLVVDEGSRPRLRPNEPATREEVAVFIYRMMVTAGKAEPIDTSEN